MNSLIRSFRNGMALSCALLVGAALGQTPDAEQCVKPGAAKSPAEEVVAMVAGQPVLARDLDNVVKSQLMALRNQEFQLKSKVLEDLIRQRVVEAEAKKQGVTVDQLYAKEVDAHVPTPPEPEVYAYYLGARAQINQPFKAVRAQLQVSLRALEVKEMRDEYIAYLRGKSDISVMLDTPRVAVAFDRDRLRGDAKAPVTIVEFADYQCPYCEKVEATVQELLKKYPGKVNVAFRDFPLTSIHPNAQKAAEAARCAARQGKYWEFHDALLGAQAKLDEPGLKSISKGLALDEKAFSSCLDSGESAALVARDSADGQKAGVSSTPGFFINGIFLSGAQPQGEFERLIESELKSAANRKTAAPSR